MTGPLLCQLLQPPPIVCQVGESITGDSMAITINMLLKNLLDVDGPFTLTEDGYVLGFVGATQRFHLIPPGSGPAPAEGTLGEHTNVNISVDTAANNDFLVYSSSTSKWRNMTVADVIALVGGGGGATPSFDSLTNVDFTGKSNLSVPYWNSTTSTWEDRIFTLADFVSGTATNGYVVTSVSGTPTWQAAAAGTLPAGTGRAGALWIGASGSGSWLYTTLGSTAFDGSWPYFLIPSGYTKARVTTQYGGYRTAGGVAGGGTSPADGDEIGCILSSGALTSGLWTNVVATYSDIAKGVKAVHISPVFAISSGQRIYPLLNNGGSAPYPATNPTFMQIELFI